MVGPTVLYYTTYKINPFYLSYLFFYCERTRVKSIQSVIRKLAFVTIVVGVSALMLVLHTAALDASRRELSWRQKTANQGKMRRNNNGALGKVD